MKAIPGLYFKNLFYFFQHIKVTAYSLIIPISEICTESVLSAGSCGGRAPSGWTSLTQMLVFLGLDLQETPGQRFPIRDVSTTARLRTFGNTLRHFSCHDGGCSPGMASPSQQDSTPHPDLAPGVTSASASSLGPASLGPPGFLLLCPGPQVPGFRPPAERTADGAPWTRAEGSAGRRRGPLRGSSPSERPAGWAARARQRERRSPRRGRRRRGHRCPPEAASFSVTAPPVAGFCGRVGSG